MTSRRLPWKRPRMTDFEAAKLADLICDFFSDMN
jgi:hypothetical protein